MINMRKMYVSILIFLLVNSVSAWTNVDFEVFDAVEEVNKNFYELMGVEKEATSSELKKAFRKLSLQLHPDKNPEPDADVQFRNLVTAYEILKDDEKRQKYNDVLRDGLPDWRQPIFYFRRVRKMGIVELVAILSIILTLGQYLMAWGAYWEKRFTLASQINEKKRRKEKKLKKRQEINDEEEYLIEKPSLWNLLPFQLLRLIQFLIVSTPSYITWCHNAYREWKERVPEESEDEEEPTPREKRPKRRRIVTLPDLSDGGCLLEPVEAPVLETVQQVSEDEEKASRYEEGCFWSDTHLAALSKLMKKYPGGTPERWEKIADAMFRTVDEVTAMAKKIKDEGYQSAVSLAAQGLTGEENAIVSDPMTMREEERTEEIKGKVKKKTTKNVVDTKVWSQKQQKALEEALKTFRKGTDGRWDKIASKVAGKSKEECISRYMMLVEKIKKKSTENSSEGKGSTNESGSTEAANESAENSAPSKEKCDNQKEQTGSSEETAQSTES